MSRPGFIEASRLDINLAILKKGNTKFEVVVDPELAIAYRRGKDVELEDVLKSDEIFSDAQKGMLASEHLMEQFFKTKDKRKVAEIIIKEGEIQLTAEFRRKLREQKLNRIVNIIHRNSINPQTNTPHPEERIRAAIEQAKLKIDEFKPAEDQVERIIKDIAGIIPIRLEVLQLEVIVPPQFAPKSYSVIKSFGGLEQSDWLNDGSLLARVKLPAGLKLEFMDKINSLTHGSAEIKIIKK